MRPKWTENGWQRILEAQKRGNETQRKRYREKYLINPKRCVFCSGIIPYDRRKNNFCNHSCAKKYNNIKYGLKERKREKNCLNCGKEMTGNGLKCCSWSCDREYKDINLWERFIQGKASKQTYKRLLLVKYGHRCQVCGNETWNDKPIPLEINHKDGHSENEKPENIELICPNCHAQTETYKSRNKGNGRHFRRIRYKEGKSY